MDSWDSSVWKVGTCNVFIQMQYLYKSQRMIQRTSNLRGNLIRKRLDKFWLFNQSYLTPFEKYEIYKYFKESSMQGKTPQEIQNEKAMTLMETLSIGMDEAINLLKRAAFDLDAAVNMQFRQQSDPIAQIIDFGGQIIDVDSGEDFALYQTNPRRRGQRSLTGKKQIRQFNKTYLIKKKEKPKPKKKRTRAQSKNSKDNSHSKEQRIEEEEKEFIPQISKILQSKVHISFVDDLADALRTMLEQKKIVALHSLELSKIIENQSCLEYLKTLYTNKDFVQNCNKMFINFGLDPSTFDFDHYPFMKDFISKGDQLSIILLRINQLSNKIDILRKWKLSETFKLTEIDNFKVIMTNVNRQHNTKAHYAAIGRHPPKQPTKQQIEKIESDRLIREEQEKQYFQHLNVVEQIKAQQLMEKKEEEKLEETLESIKEKRELKRKELKMYETEQIQNIIQFKIRMPNSSIIMLKLPKAQTIQYLFDYIDTLPNQDLGFDNEPKRHFDLLQPFQKVSLQEKKQQTIGKVFEDTDLQALIVKEL